MTNVQESSGRISRAKGPKESVVQFLTEIGTEVFKAVEASNSVDEAKTAVGSTIAVFKSDPDTLVAALFANALVVTTTTTVTYEALPAKAVDKSAAEKVAADKAHAEKAAADKAAEKAHADKVAADKAAADKEKAKV